MLKSSPDVRGERAAVAKGASAIGRHGWTRSCNWPILHRSRSTSAGIRPEAHIREADLRRTFSSDIRKYTALTPLLSSLTRSIATCSGEVRRMTRDFRQRLAGRCLSDLHPTKSPRIAIHGASEADLSVALLGFEPRTS